MHRPKADSLVLFLHSIDLLAYSRCGLVYGGKAAAAHESQGKRGLVGFSAQRTSNPKPRAEPLLPPTVKGQVRRPIRLPGGILWTFNLFTSHLQLLI